MFALGTLSAAGEGACQPFVGLAGPTGWRCHVVQPDPEDHGPDGINLHDWDGDGDLDLFVNYEEGRTSRLYFNPGGEGVRGFWGDFLELAHGKCEDSGIGDLDDDGDVDYVANGGWVYFNPGVDKVRDAGAWMKMTLFDEEQRVPTVVDVDGDGLLDLMVGAQAWYRQPVEGKHEARNWKKHVIGRNRWPMNALLNDLDGDGDLDLVVPDRGVEVCWYVNPGAEAVTGPWERRRLHPHHEPMFMALGDLDGDGREDAVITGGSKGRLARTLIILLRRNGAGDPDYEEIVLPQPCGVFPKGVAVMDLDGDQTTREILVIPKQGDLWQAGFTGDPTRVESWKTEPIRIPGAQTRKKMDNAWLCDLDGDGDLDVVTTEENGGWGVIWFENPGREGAKR